MKFYINVSGGLGYNFALARVVTKFGNEHEFYIKSPYWDVFKACPFVKYVYKAEEARDFLIDAINDEGAKIIQFRLYDLQNFILKRYNYTQAWCELLGLEYKDTDDGTSLLDLELNPNEIFIDLPQRTETVLKEVKDKGYSKFILMQFWGGQSPLSDFKNQQYSVEAEPLKRAYPVAYAQKFVSLFKEKHPDTAVILYELPNEPKIEGTLSFEVPYLSYYELSKMPECVGAVTIDSSLAHIVSGNTKVLTIWGHSLPQHFGYHGNKNIVQRCNRSDILYFTELGASGARIDYIEPKALMKEVESFIYK